MYKKIRKIRRELDFSQEYMATNLNISQRAYSMIENGEIKNIDKVKLNKILELFGISKEFLENYNSELALHQQNTFNDVGYGYIKSIKNNNKEIHVIYEERIKDLLEQVTFLKEQIATLIKNQKS